MRPRRPSSLAYHRFRSGVSEVDGSLLAEIGHVRSFTPRWEGFATSPQGPLCYVDHPLIAALWTPRRVPMTGESNAPTMTITNLPSALQPRVERFVACWLFDDDVMVSGGATITGASIRFALHVPREKYLVPDWDASTPSGRKGFAHSWTLTYLK